MVNIEIVYSPVQQPMIHLQLAVQAGATVADAIVQSGLQQSHPEITDMVVGVFAKPVAMDTLVKTGDRIEIYRPLLTDPKEKRRQRAREKRL